MATRKALTSLNIGILIYLFVGCQKPPHANSTSTLNEAWNQANAPERLQWDLIRDFSALPLEAHLEKLPWPDSYWPNTRGGIANRWNGGQDGFGYTPPTLEAAKKMSNRELKRLSPAEKYDIFKGRFDYPTVQSERKRTSPADQSWAGLCAGWAPASLHFEEPSEVELEGANGIKVPFGSSDVKGLVLYFQDKVAKAPYRMLGARCGMGPSSSAACRDVNAGSFHLTVANYLGMRKQGFVIDVTRENEVWNHPVHGFKSRVLSEAAPSRSAGQGTVRELVVETTLHYIIETQQSWTPLRGAAASLKTLTYRYRLELNINDEVLGGEWLTSARPDFAWIADKPAFSGYFDKLGEIYSAATSVVRP